LDKIDYKQLAQKWYDGALTNGNNIILYSDVYNIELPIIMELKYKENSLKYLRHIMLHTIANEYLDKL